MPAKTFSLCLFCARRQTRLVLVTGVCVCWGDNAIPGVTVFRKLSVIWVLEGKECGLCTLAYGSTLTMRGWVSDRCSTDKW